MTTARRTYAVDFLRQHPDVVRKAANGAHVEVRVGDRADFPQPRNHARTVYHPGDRRHVVIEIAPRMLRTSRARIEGVMMHELGHVWFIVRGEDDHTERDADRMAASLFGRALKYDDGDVQTTWRGRRRRPRRLPR